LGIIQEVRQIIEDRDPVGGYKPLRSRIAEAEEESRKNARESETTTVS